MVYMKIFIFLYRGRGAFFDRYEFDREDRCVDQRSENVGISNEKIGEIPIRRKSKVSWERFIHSGLVDTLSRGQLE